MPHVYSNTGRRRAGRTFSLLAAVLLVCGCGANPLGSAPPAATQAIVGYAATAEAAAHAADTHAQHSLPTAHSAPVLTPTALAATVTALPTDAIEGTGAAPLRLTGSGESQTELFTLVPGLAVFHFEHPTATPFAVFLLNEGGDHLGLLANGAMLNQRQVFGVTTAGQYTLHMIAQDAWTVQVEQPTPAAWQQQAASTRELSGQGATATHPLLLDAGSLQVRWTHTGTFPLTLVLWSIDGQQRVELVVNSTAAEGAATITVPVSAAYVLAAQTNGAWTVALGPF